MAVTNTNILTIAGSTPISTSVFSQLVAATPINCTKMVLANSTDTDIQLSYGASGSEVGLVVVGTLETIVVDIGLNIIPAGTRLAVEAVGTASTKGNFTASLIP